MLNTLTARHTFRSNRLSYAIFACHQSFAEASRTCQANDAELVWFENRNEYERVGDELWVIQQPVVIMLIVPAASASLVHRSLPTGHRASATLPTRVVTNSIGFGK